MPVPIVQQDGVANETRVAIFKQQHLHWKQDQMTRAFLSALDKHELFIVEAIANAAMNQDKTPEQIRLFAAQLATVKTIKKLVYDTETFVNKCTV